MKSDDRNGPLVSLGASGSVSEIRRLLIRTGLVAGVASGLLVVVLSYRTTTAVLVESSAVELGLALSEGSLGEVASLPSSERLVRTGGRTIEDGGVLSWGRVRRTQPRQVWASLVSSEGEQIASGSRALPPMFPEVRRRLRFQTVITGVLLTWIFVWSGFALASLVVRRLAASRAHLLEMATIDSLSGLLNRRAFSELLDARLSKDSSRGLGWVLILDLDRFRQINDALGQDVGDRIIEGVGSLLREVAPPNSLVSRLGGDEFALCVGGDQATRTELATAIQEGVANGLSVTELDLEVRSTVGTAEFPKDGISSGVLLSRAAIAVRHARHVGQSIGMFEDSHDPQSRARLQLLGRLRAAIAAGSIDVAFQPRVEPRRRRVLGFEALARWTDPEEGPIAPDVFIPLAEQNGLIPELTRLVLASSLRAAREWEQSGMPVRVSVNLSPGLMHDRRLPGRIVEALRAHGLHENLLELELTESASMIDPDFAAEALERLCATGIEVALDDFGTGMSSLAYLRDLCAGTVKIDRRFVTNIYRSESDRRVARAIIDMSHALGKRVVAEGVEDAVSLTWLSDAGCDEVQGYFIARPMPFEVTQAFLADHGHRCLDPSVSRF